MSTANDIFDRDPRQPSEEEMLAYLQGKLSKSRQREIEELISDEQPEADALEGLKLLHGTEALRSTRKLQQKLHTELLRTKHKKPRTGSEFWSWMAIIIILLLMVVGYVVVQIASK